MWPWFTRPADRWLNRKLLARRLVPLARALPQAPVAVTTLPIVAGLMDDLPVCRWVYYCVDDFGQWPGLDQAPLREMEERLVRRADVIVAVSENLQQRLRAMGRESYLLTHGVDLDFWQARPGRTLPVLEGLQRPLIVFWGVVDRRMDVAFVRRLAEDLLRGTILLVGPEADPDPELIRTRRVARLLPLPFEDLPVLAEEAAVLVMPYADLAVTRAMQPLKLKEYLATGKPVIVRDLPATRPWADGLDLAETAEAFARAVRKRLAEGLSEEQRQARRRLAAESWTEKARLFEEWALAAAPAPSGAMSC
jgi:glycosyltransferase involved in cell wall biosynthesis